MSVVYFVPLVPIPIGCSRLSGGGRGLSLVSNTGSLGRLYSAETAELFDNVDWAPGRD